MKSMWCLILCTTLAASACAPEQATISQALDTSGTRADAPVGVDALPPKPATPLPRLEVLDPDAKALAEHPSMPMPTALPTPQQERLQAAPVPVLIPSAMTESQLAAAQVTTGEHWAAISSTHDGVTLYIQGTRTSMEHPSIELDKAGDDTLKQPYVLSRTHQIVSVAFTRFGLGYLLDIECARPMADARCTSDEYAISLYESLTLVEQARGGVR